MFRVPCLLLIAAGLSACVETDPYTRNYSWQPTGANASNIAAQVANKNDLIRGRGATTSDPIESVTPVFRLYEGKTTPLPLTTSKGI